MHSGRDNGLIVLASIELITLRTSTIANSHSFMIKLFCLFKFYSTFFCVLKYYNQQQTKQIKCYFFEISLDFIFVYIILGSIKMKMKALRF